MSSPITTNQSTYPTVESTHHDNSCNVQPESPNASQHYRFEQGPPQRRRVNPESLAARLGPELVAEMEKYIIPGRIEMPPFSIRRDIQIKFGIDRRHIYDFFHSRGLRCLNEKATRNNYLESKSPRPARSLASPPTFPEPKKRRAAAAASVITSSFLKRTRASTKQKGRQRRLERRLSSAEPDNITPSLLEPELDVIDLKGNVVTQELLLSSNASESCLTPDVSSTHFLGQFSMFSSGESEPESDFTPCHSVSSLLDLGSSISTPSLSTSSSMSSTCSSPHEVAEPRPKALPLSSEERKAHYAWLDGIIGPASGIQEGVGTYKAFMEHQRDVYYDRLRYIAEHSTKLARSRPTNEFLSWLGNAPPSQADIPPRALAPPLVTVPQLDFGPTASPGPSQAGCNTDTCRYSRSQPLGVTQNVRSNPRLPDWTRHTRRQTLSATADM